MKNMDKHHQRFMRMCLIAVVMMLPRLAFAEPWDDASDAILDIFTGGLTRTLAIIAIIVAGVMAMFGKMQWQWVINIVVGIVLIFGGAAIVDYIIDASST
jgi:type IV secretion system protein VirB2